MDDAQEKHKKHEAGPTSGRQGAAAALPGSGAAQRAAAPTLVIVILGALPVFIGSFWLARAGAAEQLKVLREILPRSWQTLQEGLRSHALGLGLLDL